MAKIVMTDLHGLLGPILFAVENLHFRLRYLSMGHLIYNLTSEPLRNV